MTELRYLPDSDDVYAFTADVVAASEKEILLDGTYFYPVGGGQPADHGVISWDGGEAQVTNVRKDHGDVRHALGSVTGHLPNPGDSVRGQIDSHRREQLSRMHTAQHVVSRVVLDKYGGETAGNQIHTDRSRIDFSGVSFDADDLKAIEESANNAIRQDLPVEKTFKPRADVEARTADGRSQLSLIPASVDPLRVVAVPGFDFCPCGGTHVNSLGEIGPIEITDRSSKGAGVDRIEFVLDSPVGNRR